MKTLHIILICIFVLSLTVRFWWYPQNVYFGYDQARDATISQEIYKNKDIKIIGPSAGQEGLFHGPLYWYLLGPLYLVSHGNPAFVSGIISVLNALGVFLIFFLAKQFFDDKVSLIASFLYAISFSMTQYALYFANPAPAILTIMLYFLGWALVIFKKKPVGWVIMGFGLGLSIQFEFFLIYLISTFPVIFLIYFKDIKREFNLKFFTLGLLSLLISLSTFILAEIKYGFRTTKVLMGTFLHQASIPDLRLASSTFWERLGTEIYYDAKVIFFKMPELFSLSLILLIVFALFKYKNSRKLFIFFSIWIFSNLLLDIFRPPQLYYVGIGLSIPIFLIFSFYLEKLRQKSKLIFMVATVLFILINIKLMVKYNPSGPVDSLYVQKGELLLYEKEVINQIYDDANGQKFTVNALTMPYKIKTTWAYLFNWYGKQKYGYIPFWGGEDVPGYEGNLPQPDSSKNVRYAILEPERGIPESLKKTFIDSENGYNKPVWEKEIGDFVLQKRIPN